MATSATLVTLTGEDDGLGVWPWLIAAARRVAKVGLKVGKVAAKGIKAARAAKKAARAVRPAKGSAPSRSAPQRPADASPAVRTSQSALLLLAAGVGIILLAGRGKQ